jgi:SAM-dependent methyltransferase
MHEYGKTNWESLWELLEQQGNIGLDYVINPALYPRVMSFLAEHPKAIVVDFGSGTNLMGVQLLFGYASSVPGLKNVPTIDQARFNTLLYVGIEGSQELVDQSNRYFGDIGNPKNIGTVKAHIGADLEKLFDNETVDLCTSRNFLMHLSSEDLDSHLKYVSEMLKPGGYYIFATLNPDYELQKANRNLMEGELYDFMHGKDGEYGVFYHYYKSREHYENSFKQNFEIEETVYCLPITPKYKESHARYYSDSTPMALVYVLRKK